jgi:hypothetical protein
MKNALTIRDSRHSLEGCGKLAEDNIPGSRISHFGFAPAGAMEICCRARQAQTRPSKVFEKKFLFWIQLIQFILSEISNGHLHFGSLCQPK